MKQFKAAGHMVIFIIRVRDYQCQQYGLGCTHAHIFVLLSRYAVGVLDKASGVMRYAEAGTGNIVRMEPRARGVNYAPTGARTEQEDDRQARILQNKKCAKQQSMPLSGSFFAVSSTHFRSVKR